MVALSRARLGLNTFGRQVPFANATRWDPTFRQLLAQLKALAMVERELHGPVACTVGDASPPWWPKLMTGALPQV